MQESLSTIKFGPVGEIERAKHRIDLSREQIAAEGFRHKNQALIDGGIKYGSRSEIACSRLLQKYLPGWLPVEGQTFQVPIGYNKRCDFYLPARDQLIEFHPIILKYEIQHRGAAREIERALWRMDRQTRAGLEDALVAELRLQYFKKRRFALDYGDGRFAHTELVLVCSSEEFVERVLRFSGQKRNEALAEWKRIVSSKKI